MPQMNADEPGFVHVVILSGAKDPALAFLAALILLIVIPSAAQRSRGTTPWLLLFEALPFDFAAKAAPLGVTVRNNPPHADQCPIFLALTRN
jgi:hypothetical protein